MSDWPNRILVNTLDCRLGHGAECITENADRLVPSQPSMSSYFDGGAAELYRRMESAMCAVLPAKRLEDKWNIVGKVGMPYSSLGSEFSALHFYQMLIHIGQYKQVLEIGTFIGVSTLFLAEAAGAGGKVTSIECGQEFYDLAHANVKRNGLSERVNLVLGDALETVKTLAAAGLKYDFILLDAAKEIYSKLLWLCLGCLNPGGVIVIDDIFMSGDTLNPVPKTDKARGIQSMLHMVAAMGASFSRVILPIGNGVMLIYPRHR